MPSGRSRHRDSGTNEGRPPECQLRGANPDAVLVLLDGIPLNDPVTGEADLSTVSARSLTRATVLAARCPLGSDPGRQPE